ncbi:unnamed protein product [Blepharisma stoltei]|uniref:Uncharacterized protein n=1 Tax=Blepharisma stoltei TaxID=1481888 RepID=A0AAU9J0J8_9CILI|nr:unnamed protein product [Blepharisma stoltei]
MEYKLEGNPWTFGVFMVFNVIFMIVGIGIATVGIYVVLDVLRADWYNISFAVLGVAIIISAIIGHKTRFSQAAMNVYMISLAFIFAAQLAFTLAIVIWSNFTHKIKYGSAWAVRIFMIIATTIIGVCLVVGFLYRKSLNEVNFSHKTAHSLSLPGITPLVRGSN